MTHGAGMSSVKAKSVSPSGTVFLTMVIEPRWVLEYVHVQFSPSLRAIATEEPVGVAVPPFAEVTLQTTPSNPQPAGIGVSLSVYVWRSVMSGKTLVLAEVPSSTSE